MRVADGYAPTFDSSAGFIAAFAISFLAYYHQSFVWPKWRFYSLIMAFGCLMESLGEPCLARSCHTRRMTFTEPKHRIYRTAHAAQ